MVKVIRRNPVIREVFVGNCKCGCELEATDSDLRTGPIGKESGCWTEAKQKQRWAYCPECHRPVIFRIKIADPLCLVG